ncbi:MAG: tetratricopeptide repeat protein [Devosia sp.]|nr:tetratricopeptide repeat protein [Devosia sp.]
MHTLFTRVFGLVQVLVLALGIGWAQAGEAEDQAALDRLFAQLRVASDAAAAHAIDQQIWMLWTSPSDPTLAGRMREVLAARGIGDLTGGIRLLDELVTDYPDYAEAWNQRATLYYMVGRYDDSIADCARVLALEPRHFGALSGRSLMYLQQGRRDLALKDMATAVAIHPYLSERQLFPELGEPATRI